MAFPSSSRHTNTSECQVFSCHLKEIKDQSAVSLEPLVRKYLKHTGRGTEKNDSMNFSEMIFKKVYGVQTDH